MDVWNRLPFVEEARPIGKLRVTLDPVFEPLSWMPDSDFEDEGFAYFEEHPEFIPNPCGPLGGWTAFQEWRASGESLWVVRFEPLEIYS